MRSYKIAFQITTHVGSEQIHMLLRKIYHFDNLYLIYIDLKSLEAHRGIINDFRHVENVLFLSDTKISWASKSILDTSLHGLHTLLNHAKWERYVLMSGQDFPVVPIDALDSKLSRPGTFIGIWSAINDFSNEHDTRDVNDKLNFDDKTPLDHIIWNRRFSSILVHPGTEFKYRNHHDIMRINYDYNINNVNDCLSISNSKPFMRTFIENWFASERRLGFGQAWVLLDRVFCEWLFQSNIVSEIYMLVRNFLFPDECFFQTAIINSDYMTSHNNRTLTFFDHKINGNIGEDSIKTAIDGGFVFIRKLNIATLPVVRPIWERLVGEDFHKCTLHYQSLGFDDGTSQ